MAMTNRERGNIFGRLMSIKQMWELGFIDDEMWESRRDELLDQLMDEDHIVEGVL